MLKAIEPYLIEQVLKQAQKKDLFYKKSFLFQLCKAWRN